MLMWPYIRHFRCYAFQTYKSHVYQRGRPCREIQQAIGPHEDLLTIAKRRQLKWYGHVSRSSGLAKTILQGTVKGGRRKQGRHKKRWEDSILQGTVKGGRRRQGRHKKRWEDSIRERSGLEFAKFPEGNGEQWKVEKNWL